MSDRGRVAWLALAAALAAGCAAYSPHAELGRVAPSLGAASRGDRCPWEPGPLTRATLDAWAERPGPRRTLFAPELACVALRDDLVRDTRVDCTPDVRETFTRAMLDTTRIEGEHAYVGLDPREYAYDLSPGAIGGYAVEVRVQLTGALARDPREVDAMQRKMDRAADFWTEHSPGEKTRFRFRAVTDDASAPHFSVELLAGDPRSPYDVSWGSEWSWHLLAHEIGHMMGLGDEYGQVRKTFGHAFGEEARWTRDVAVKTQWFQCNVDSLMCDSKGEQSAPLAYHYYVILRRRLCAQRAFTYPEF